MKTDSLTDLRHLFTDWCGEIPVSADALPPTASNRSYYRIKSKNFSAIGAHNPNYKENRAFISMTRFFRDERIHVPKVYRQDLNNDIYILEDLGDQTLFSVLLEAREEPANSPRLKSLLRGALGELARIQVSGGKRMDFSICHPYRQFHRDSVLFDLNYFRKQFLDQSGIPYHREKLQHDFHHFADYIMQADNEHLMYRDFQSRNIMLHKNAMYFIDYQGSREGPLQYDVASFLFQARAGLSEQVREEMIEYYMGIAGMLTPINKKDFLEYFYPIALVRILQTLGAYGLRGLKEKKQHFIKSIPLALRNVHLLEQKTGITGELPELHKVLGELKHMKTIQ